MASSVVHLELCIRRGSLVGHPKNHSDEWDTRLLLSGMLVGIVVECSRHTIAFTHFSIHAIDLGVAL